ncbi:MAG: hypothetical protein PHW04_02020 [Candidatus Wallbacteria bacterium]|nr:hypothetical protein [Candidatus Wallbacteria bacterium]
MITTIHLFLLQAAPLIQLASHHHDDSDPVVYAAIGFFAGLYFFYSGFQKLRLKRTIENTPTSKIRSMAMGLVEVNGKALGRKNLLSPMHLKPCVYFQWKVDQWVSSKNGGHWSLLSKGESNEAFFIEDDTARAIVFPEGATMNLKTDYCREFSSFSTLPAELTAFLKQKHINYESLFGGHRRLRFTEIFIAPNDGLYILGTAAFWQKKADADNLDNPDPDLAAQMKSMALEDNKCVASIRKGEQWFYLSDSSEKDILSSLGWWAPFAIFGGPLLTLVCMIYLLFRLGVR